MFRGLFCTESESLRGVPVVGSRFSSSNVSLLTNSLIPSSKRRSTGLVTSTLLSNTGQQLETTDPSRTKEPEDVASSLALSGCRAGRGVLARFLAWVRVKPAKCPYKEASYISRLRAMSNARSQDGFTKLNAFPLLLSPNHTQLMLRSPTVKQASGRTLKGPSPT